MGLNISKNSKYNTSEYAVNYWKIGFICLEEKKITVRVDGYFSKKVSDLKGEKVKYINFELKNTKEGLTYSGLYDYIKTTEEFINAIDE